MKQSLTQFYQRLVIDRPVLTLMLVLIATLTFSGFIPNFKLDISADSLVLEHDEDLKYYRAIHARYGADDYLIVTYTPRAGLFDGETIGNLRNLRDSLAAIQRVESVISILDVPLLESPPITLAELQKRTPTLDDGKTDLELAKRELQRSPLYRNRLVGEAGDTTALQINFKRDQTYIDLRDGRDGLREVAMERSLTDAEVEALEQFEQAFKDYSSRLMAEEERDIATIRAIVANYRDRAEIHLGGLPMIVADMMEYVRHDLRVFGVGVLVILAMLLTITFRQPRWVLLPLCTALVASLITVGIVGLYGWRVTIVSSNFITLILIFALSLTIHLVVRYRELQMLYPDADEKWLVSETIRSKVRPSFYTVITTMVAFGSLVVSGIRPVIDFGWIMVIGLAVSFVLSFTLFPAVLMLLKPVGGRERRDLTARITDLSAHVIENHSNWVLAITAAVLLLGATGVTQLTVENRFIDYFKQETEIYQGMELIDKKLGGTTPLDVVIDAPADFFEEEEPDEEADEEDGFALEGEAGITATSYWFNSYALEEIDAIHRYLEGIDETGKVLSLSTSMAVLKTLNHGKPLNDYFMSVLYKRLPEDVKRGMVTPYISEDGNQLRFAVRVYESDVALVRQQLLEKIRSELSSELGLAPEQVHLSGMMVLFNNMLQSLYRSQVLTLGAVFLAILLMFAVLFRSIPRALVAIIPNVVSATLVLGVMGWLGIPLDIMTITIAAISVGIGVDDTIHYVHRYGEELEKDWDYREAIFRSHNSIGRAMYFTSITITVGFSILVFSSFVPTIYFGLLTAFAMITALIANVTLLPILLEKLKPFKRVV